MEDERTKTKLKDQFGHSRHNMEAHQPLLSVSPRTFLKERGLELTMVLFAFMGILAVGALSTGICSFEITSETNDLVRSKKPDQKKLNVPLQQVNLLLAVNPFLESARLDRARIYSKQHRYAEAIADYDVILQRNPNHVDALERRAAANIALRNFPAVLKDCDKVIELQNEKVSEYIYADRAIAHSMLGQKEAAIEDFSNALKIKSTNPDFYRGRGDTFRDMHRYEDAIEDYEWVAMLNPGSGDASLGKAQCYVLQKKFPKALASLDRAVALEPDNPKFQVERGKVYWAMSKADEALASFDKALALDPQNVDALTEEMRIHSSRQEDAKALQDANRIIMAGSLTYDSYMRRADLEMVNDKPRLAVLGYERAAELAPNEITPLIGEAWALASTKGEQKAVSVMDKAIKLKPGDPELFAIRGHFNMLAGNGMTADKDFVQAVGLDANNMHAYLWRGEGHYNQRDFVSAEQDFQKALRLDPKNKEAKDYLTQTSLAIKNAPRAHVASSSSSNSSETVASANDPKIKTLLVSNNFNDVSTAGLNYYRGGNYAAAIRVLSKAVKMQPSATDARRGLAASLMASGYPSPAASQYEGVIAQAPGNASDMHELCKALFDAKRFEEAITYCNQYLEKNSSDVDIRCLLIQAYQSTGFKKKAQEVCTESIHSANDASALQRYEGLLKSMTQTSTPASKQAAPTNKPLPDTQG